MRIVSEQKKLTLVRFRSGVTFEPILIPTLLFAHLAKPTQFLKSFSLHAIRQVFRCSSLRFRHLECSFVLLLTFYHSLHFFLPIKISSNDRNLCNLTKTNTFTVCCDLEIEYNLRNFQFSSWLFWCLESISKSIRSTNSLFNTNYTNRQHLKHG